MVGRGKTSVNPYVCGHFHTQRILRFTFILKLAFVSLFFLYTLFANDNSMQDYVEDEKEFERHLEPPANVTIEERFDHYNWYTLARPYYEGEQLQSVSGFIRNLSTCASHFFVALLLWASVYPKKKHCLPLYAVLEGVLIIEITMSILRILTVVMLSRSRKDEHLPLGYRRPFLRIDFSSIGWIGSFVVILPFIIYCALFLPFVVVPYYKFLKEKESRRRNRSSDVEMALVK